MTAEPSRVYPAPPPRESIIRGAFDFHVHSSPDVFDRSVDDDALGVLAALRQMGGLVLKNHVSETASRAYLLRRRVPGLQVFGGIVLNAAVGGLNAQAVQWMARVQGQYGRVVWLPSFDADHHVRFFKERPEGIRVVERGKAVPAVLEIMRICKDLDLVLCTGHASSEEALVLARAAAEVGLRKLVVTHALFAVVDMTVEQMREAADCGAVFELASLGTFMGPGAHIPWMTHWKRVTPEDNVRVVKAIGPDRFVLGTDLGQVGNPSHPDGYQFFVQQLLGAGLSRDEVAPMARVTPSRLLGVAS